MSINSTCIQHSDCASGPCHLGVCLAAKLNDPCKVGQCPTGLYCHAMVNRCKVPHYYYNGTCATYTDCSPSDYCRNGSCVKRPSEGQRCNEQMRCRSGYSCRGGVCVRNCFNDGQCSAGKVCQKTGGTYNFCLHKGPPNLMRDIREHSLIILIAVMCGMIILGGLIVFFKMRRRRSSKKRAMEVLTCPQAVVSHDPPPYQTTMSNKQ